MKLYANLAGIDVGDGFPVRVMGVLNVSPESFYHGSVAIGRRAVQKQAVRMAEEGADILDVGAMSTAPYLQGTISEREEEQRLTAAIAAVRGVVDIPISADTQRSRVAAAALAAGATIINDVSGLGADAEMAAVVRQAQGVVLMASERGASAQRPTRMIMALLRECLRRARQARIPRRRIVLDPGIGFFRRAAVPWYELDCSVLHELGRLRPLGQPLLVGVSRKSFIGKLTQRTKAEERLAGSLGATAIAVYNGAAIVRTHDVAGTVDAVRVAEAIKGHGGHRGDRLR